MSHAYWARLLFLMNALDAVLTVWMITTLHPDLAREGNLLMGWILVYGGIWGFMALKVLVGGWAAFMGWRIQTPMLKPLTYTLVFITNWNVGILIAISVAT